MVHSGLKIKSFQPEVAVVAVAPGSHRTGSVPCDRKRGEGVLDLQAGHIVHICQIEIKFSVPDSVDQALQHIVL